MSDQFKINRSERRETAAKETEMLPGERSVYEVATEKRSRFGSQPQSQHRDRCHGRHLRHRCCLGDRALVTRRFAQGDRSQGEHRDTGQEDEHADEEVKLSPEALAAAGIEIEGVTQRPAVALIKVTGTVETNQQQTQQASPLVSGRIERVNVGQGDRRSRGSVLAIISSPEVAEMHGKLREAETRLRLGGANSSARAASRKTEWP